MSLFDAFGTAEPVREPARELARVSGGDRLALEPVMIRHEMDHRFVKKPDGKRGCATCGAGKGKLIHYGSPDSFNEFGSGAHRFAYQAKKQAWQALWTELLEASGLPRGLGRVVVEGRVCFPRRGPRDQGNYRYPIEKSLGDALEKGGWLVNDDWEHYEFGQLGYAYEKGRWFTELYLFPSWPEEENGGDSGNSGGTP